MGSDYEDRTRGSGRLYERAKKVFAGGVNHNARYFPPYPLFISKARGQHLWDEDGNRYTDYWMGHTALILGHSPQEVVDAVSAQLENGTLYGMGSRLSLELGEKIQKAVPCAEMLRFCNTGAEATMYLVRVARAYTKRRTIIKIAGGWHGYNTELNKAVHPPYDRLEGQGILSEEQAHIVPVRFNDLEIARKVVRKLKGDIATMLLEPVLGAGGCIPANRDYLRGLRELADKEGFLLAFDEIITGFRLGLGGAQEYYCVEPDLATFGKIIGGGLPIGLVCGIKEAMSMANPSQKMNFVSIGGGTFSENPLSMVAGIATVKYLKENRNNVYPRLEGAGAKVRREIDRAFAENGVLTSTMGAGSLFLTHFGDRPDGTGHQTPQAKRSTSEYGLFLASHGIFCLGGHPCAISTKHKSSDLDALVEVAGRFARQVRSKNRQ